MPVLDTLLELHHLVLLHYELDGVGRLLVHLDLGQVPFSVEDNFVQILLCRCDLCLFLFQLFGFVGER